MTEDPKKETFRSLRHIFYRFCFFALFISILIISGLIVSLRVSSVAFDWENVEFPWNYKPHSKPMDLEYENYTILLDAHSHTVFSDGSLSPTKNIEWHISNGFNAMILTDHNNIEGALETRRIARERYDDQIKVILGVEWSSCRVHMNLIGIEEMVPSSAFPTDLELQQVINATHEQGGLVIINHRPWSMNGDALVSHPTLENIRDWGIDYIEVLNGATFDYEGYQFALENGIGIISGTDMHSPGKVNSWTVLKPDTNATDGTLPSESEILAALTERKTSLIFNAINSPYSSTAESSPSNFFLDPFFRLGQLLRGYYLYSNGMYSFNHSFCRERYFDISWTLIIILILWIFISFVSFEVLRWIGVSIIQQLIRYRQKSQQKYLFALEENPPKEKEEISVELKELTVK